MATINKVGARYAARALAIVLMSVPALASDCRPPAPNRPGAVKDLTHEQYLALRLLARQEGRDPCFYVDAMRHMSRAVAEAAASALAKEAARTKDDQKRAARGPNYRDPKSIDLCPPPHRMTADGCR